MFWKYKMSVPVVAWLTWLTIIWKAQILNRLKTLQIKLFRNRPKKEVRRKSRAEVDMASSEEDDDSDQSEKGNKKRNKDYDSSNRLETSV